MCQSLLGLRPATLLKKRLWQRCFLVNFVNFQRIHFLQNTSGRLLLEVNNEDHPREANKSKEALLDINALNLQTTGQRAFIDVGVFNLFALRHSKKAVEKCFRANENKKKRRKLVLHSPALCCKWRYGKRMHSDLQKISRDTCR